MFVTSYSVTYCIYSFGLQIVFNCLYIAPSHYHHCANLSEDIELIKCLSDIFCWVCKIRHINSVIHYTIYETVCFQFTHFLCGDWENIQFVLLSSSNRKYELYPLFRVRSWNNGMCCMSLYILTCVGSMDVNNDIFQDLINFENISLLNFKPFYSKNAIRNIDYVSKLLNIYVILYPRFNLAHGQEVLLIRRLDYSFLCCVKYTGN